MNICMRSMMLSRQYIIGSASSAVTLLRSRWLTFSAFSVQTPRDAARPWSRRTRSLYTGSINSTSKDTSRLNQGEDQPANLKPDDQLQENDAAHDRSGMDPQRWQEIASEYHQPRSASGHSTDPTLQNQAIRDSSEQSVADDQTKVHGILEDFSLQNLLKNIQTAKAGPVTKPAKPAPKIQRSTMMEIDELVDVLHQENAQDICVISVPPERQYVKYFVTCSGMGTRHIGRMADNLCAEVPGVSFVLEHHFGPVNFYHQGETEGHCGANHGDSFLLQLKKVKVGRGGRVTVEGRECEDWMAVDLGTTVVHFMTEDARERYELEKLWTLGHSYDDQYREIEEIVSSKGEDWLSSRE